MCLAGRSRHPLQKVTLKCPCGRRVSHTAVPAGQRPGILTCDAECERQKRSSRLASAFGIEDPGQRMCHGLTGSPGELLP